MLGFIHIFQIRSADQIGMTSLSPDVQRIKQEPVEAELDLSASQCSTTRGSDVATPTPPAASLSVATTTSPGTARPQHDATATMTSQNDATAAVDGVSMDLSCSPAGCDVQESPLALTTRPSHLATDAAATVILKQTIPNVFNV